MKVNNVSNNVYQSKPTDMQWVFKALNQAKRDNKPEAQIIVQNEALLAKIQKLYGDRVTVENSKSKLVSIAVK